MLLKSFVISGVFFADTQTFLLIVQHKGKTNQKVKKIENKMDSGSTTKEPADTPYQAQEAGWKETVSERRLQARTPPVPRILPAHQAQSRFKIKKPAASYFPAFSSIIGAEVLDFRVRNGNGYCHLAMATGIDCLLSRVRCLRGSCPGRRLAHAL